MIRTRLAVAALAAAVTLLAACYGGRLDGDWVWDDVYLVAHNPVLTEPSGLRRIWTEDLGATPQQDERAVYRPLPVTSLWAQAHVGMLTVVEGRLGNLALHLACAVLLVLLALRLGAPGPTACAVALVLVVHPSATEPVMWVCGRHDLMGTACALGALVMSPRDRASSWRTLLCAALCSAALLSKETFVVVPVLLAMLAWVERTSSRTAVAGLGGTCGVLLLRHALHITSSTSALHATLGQQLATYATLVWHYVAQLVSLSSGPTIETYEPLAPWACAVVLLCLVLLCLVLVLVRRLSGARPIALGVAWMLVALAPNVLSLPVTGQYGNRYGYFPLVGLLLATSALIALVRPPRRATAALTVALGALLATGIWRTRNEALSWHDDLALYRASVEANPSDGRALYHYGFAIGRRDGCGAALPFYIEATRTAPTFVRAWRNLAGCLINVGRPADAVEPARRAVALSPAEASQHYNLGAALVLSGHEDEGRRELETALRVDPGHAPARALLDHVIAR